MIRRIFLSLLLVFCINVSSVFAQSRLEDSLALVDLYDSTNGDSWTNNTNWKSGNLETWYGVTVSGGRVSSLILDNNNLAGNIPASIGDLTNLTWLSLVGNQLTGSIPTEIGDLTSLDQLGLADNEFADLPSLSALSVLSELRIQENKFTFEDIEPNVDVASDVFIYSPQDSVGESLDTALFKGSSFNMSISVGGDSNQYQWEKEGIIIPSATDSSYTIVAANLSHGGVYTCKITNKIATELTLNSRPINVTVFDTIPPATPQNLSATPDTQQITLLWTPNIESDIYKYNIYRDTTSPAVTFIDSVVASSSPPDTFYLDTTLN